MTLASTIATLRRERGLTLHQMFMRTGYSTAYVSDVEHGRRAVSIGAAASLARALDADPADFVRQVLQERLDAAGVALTVLVQPSRERR